jgi:hypothetical protein
MGIGNPEVLRYTAPDLIRRVAEARGIADVTSSLATMSFIDLPLTARSPLMATAMPCADTVPLTCTDVAREVAVATVEAKESFVNDAVVLAAPAPQALSAPAQVRATRAVAIRFGLIFVS